MSDLVCNSCGNNLGQRTKETDTMVKCPICGSRDLSYHLVLKDKIELHENIKGKSSKMPGKKKPASEFQAGQEKSVGLNKWVDKQRVIDRVNDRYYEKVVDPDTGNIIHECEEPLSEHFGHGSAKKKE